MEQSSLEILTADLAKLKTELYRAADTAFAIETENPLLPIKGLITKLTDSVYRVSELQEKLEN